MKQIERLFTNQFLTYITISVYEWFFGDYSVEDPRVIGLAIVLGTLFYLTENVRLYEMRKMKKKEI